MELIWTSPEVSANYVTMAVDPVLVILIFIGAQFGTGFLGKVGEDAWDALKGLVRQLRDELEKKSQILVEDDEGLQLILGPDSPAEALTSLPEDVRQAAGESGQLNWDEADGRWKSPF